MSIKQTVEKNVLHITDTEIININTKNYCSKIINRSKQETFNHNAKTAYHHNLLATLYLFHNPCKNVQQ